MSHSPIVLFAVALASAGCAGAAPQACDAGRTMLDGTCVSPQVADYVACVRAQGAHLNQNDARKLSAEAGYAGANAKLASDVSSKLEREYSTSDANTLEIIKACARFQGPPSAEAVAAPASPPLALLGAQLDIKDPIEFESGRGTLRDSAASRGVLGAVLEIMKNTPAISHLRVESHTDSDGPAADNQALSDARASAVVSWLVANGIAAARLTAAGCAARASIAPNDSAEHKAQNRRTEFYIEEMSGKRPAGYTAACTPNPSRR